jgi:hypothetical protein
MCLHLRGELSEPPFERVVDREVGDGGILLEASAEE